MTGWVESKNIPFKIDRSINIYEISAHLKAYPESLRNRGKHDYALDIAR